MSQAPLSRAPLSYLGREVALRSDTVGCCPRFCFWVTQDMLTKGSTALSKARSLPSSSLAPTL